jgi:hypothetical protein
MGEADTEMQRWCDEALVFLRSILDAAAGREGDPDADVDGDGLPAAVHHAERWTVMHPCPDSQLGEELAHLVDIWSAAVGQSGHDGATEEEARPLDPDQSERRIRELTGDTVRLQAKVEAELLSGQ